MTAGLVRALLLTRLLSSMLFGVTATDAITFVLVPVLLLAATTVACAVPATRAIRIDPVTALRNE